MKGKQILERCHFPGNFQGIFQVMGGKGFSCRDPITETENGRDVEAFLTLRLGGDCTPQSSFDVRWLDLLGIGKPTLPGKSTYPRPPKPVLLSRWFFTFLKVGCGLMIPGAPLLQIHFGFGRNFHTKSKRSVVVRRPAGSTAVWSWRLGQRVGYVRDT